MTPNGRFTLLPTRRTDPRASLVAVVLQLLFIAILGSAIAVPIAYEAFQTPDVRPERVRFIAVDTVRPRVASRGPSAPRAGGDGRPLTPTPATPSTPIVVAPVEVPLTIPEVTGPVRAPVGGSGPLIGGGGPTQGIRPSFNDPRLWLPPARPGDYVEGPFRPMTRADTLQALLNAYGVAYIDSLRKLPAGSAVPAWVYERDGRKYGIDGGMIRLGDYAIPTALLALLPLNIPVTQSDLARARFVQSMRNEMQRQVEVAQRDDDFRRAVQALRERKERERREAEAARRAGTPPP